MTTLWIGTYPPAGLGTPTGQGEGLWRARIGADGSLTSEQVTVQHAPSFLLAHPSGNLMYAVEETSPTALTVHDAVTGAEIRRLTLAGNDGCHVALSPHADSLYVCHYGTGDLSVVGLDAVGLPLSTVEDQVMSHSGSGPRADRQERSHAHFSCVSPDGHHVLVADLGTDQIRRYSIGPRGLLGDAGIAAQLPPGSGPRHLAVRGDLIYVVCELDHQVRTLRWDRGSATATLIAQQPSTLAPQRTGEGVFDGHVAIASLGETEILLVSVRGSDVISVFDIAPEGELTYRAAFDAGAWPRHFAVAPGALVVAASRSHELRSFALADVFALPPEMERGAVAELPHRRVDVVSPASVAFTP